MRFEQWLEGRQSSIKPIPLQSKNEDEAKIEAVKISQDNPGFYVVIMATFGLFAHLSKRLHVFSPSDSVFDWYVLNGQIKNFTTSQRVSDQINTPGMS